MLNESTKPFVQACENNKAAIADALSPYMRGINSVLEIGSGTGQHAVYFADRFPHLSWQTSDLPEQLSGIKTWLRSSSLPNLRMPVVRDLSADSWEDSGCEAIYAANVVHIIRWPLVQQLFHHVGRSLEINGLLILYGPFNYGGRFTSEGNRRLDAWLKAQDDNFGVRDFEQMDQLARDAGLSLLEDITMPANNRTLIWRRLEAT